MTGNPTLDTGFGSARLDDGAGGAIRDRFGQDHPVAADAPEQRAVMDAACVAPRRDPPHGRFADEQYRALSLLVRLAAMHGEPAGPVRLGLEVGNLGGDGLGHAEQAIAGERDKCSIAKPGKLPVAIGCHGGNGIGFGPLEAPYLAAATPAPLTADLRVFEAGASAPVRQLADLVPSKVEHFGDPSPNPRFLILPWIQIPNLGSHILAIVRRRLPADWAARYNITPVLIEAFVETPRYTGAVYQASGWTHVGTTQGRGRYDRDKLYDKPRKDVWLRPLRRDWQRALTR